MHLLQTAACKKITQHSAAKMFIRDSALVSSNIGFMQIQAGSPKSLKDRCMRTDEALLHPYTLTAAGWTALFVTISPFSTLAVTK